MVEKLGSGGMGVPIRSFKHRAHIMKGETKTYAVEDILIVEVAGGHSLPGSIVELRGHRARTPNILGSPDSRTQSYILSNGMSLAVWRTRGQPAILDEANTCGSLSSSSGASEAASAQTASFILSYEESIGSSLSPLPLGQSIDTFIMSHTAWRKPVGSPVAPPGGWRGGRETFSFLVVWRIGY